MTMHAQTQSVKLELKPHFSIVCDTDPTQNRYFYLLTYTIHGRDPVTFDMPGVGSRPSVETAIRELIRFASDYDRSDSVLTAGDIAALADISGQSWKYATA